MESVALPVFLDYLKEEYLLDEEVLFGIHTLNFDEIMVKLWLKHQEETLLLFSWIEKRNGTKTLFLEEFSDRARNLEEEKKRFEERLNSNCHLQEYMRESYRKIQKENADLLKKIQLLEI
ncbi:hypothetical protein LAU_0086 [Lausannevirus]|uniref:Uncharacterized protein n=2 Tax=Lausannevirus TaxID=999883 RepID=A0A0N9P8K2_9VIRU|nr:hypothetical protein LAU_0086 [Lausannevirus]AEA06939.1 hypothetical protein LAU_0086 [Lausannevirus]ALH06777.1 hypothetical protein PMV_079 [Port-miou virus]